jgi:tetratricopeptide (TPR) repeat protein
MMKWMVVVCALLLAALPMGAWAQVLVAQPAAAQQVLPIMVDLITPPSDDLGHYMPISLAGSYAVQGAVASTSPVTSVLVGNAPAVLFPVNYHVLNAPSGYVVTGFRAWVFLQPTTLMAVSVRTQAGDTRDASYLPDADTTIARLSFWRQTLPEEPYVALRAGVGNAILGQYPLALSEFNRVLGVYPDLGLARQMRALTLWDMGDWNGALADLQALVAAAPDAYSPQVDLARLLHTMGNYDAAIAHYQTALDLMPNAAEAHYLLGQAMRENGDPVLASSQQEAALQDNPGLPDAQYELGVISAEQNNTDQAFYRFQRAVENNPRSGDALLALSQMYFARGEYPRAWRMLARAEKWGAVAPPAYLDALNANMSEPYNSLHHHGL